jgi:hypothetical protein
VKSAFLMFAGGVLLYVVLSGKTDDMWKALFNLEAPVPSNNTAPVAPAVP